MGTGNITVKEAFFRSSNVAFAKLAEQYYRSQPSKFIEHLHKFRLDVLTGIDIAASSGKPTIKKPGNVSLVKNNNSLYGTWLRRIGYTIAYVDAYIMQ